MALKDSFINLNKALRTTLQNVPAVVDTLIRGFDEIGDAAEEENTYSSTEKEIGRWAETPLYETTISCGTLPDTSSKTIAHGIANVDMIYGIEGIAARSNGTTLPLPYIQANNNIALTASRDSIYITTEGDRTPYIGYVTLRYTKSAPSRSPKNDTKNVIDDDPDVKTVEEPAEELKK